ncbi:uncharacterized protein LOC127288809 [Leptopilina boulardi]|uniref:uncharacterized protein LOC127288809 n=1 Tax=Leptopilina boulardi TaxID=63433 RepID=UPI0021F61695|nr:uncharacterized protein LOC127288809 [Leptopilina boulardi]
MPAVCCINGCDSGRRTKIKSKICPSLFSANTDEIFRIWSDAIAPHTTKLYTKNRKICELHFRAEDVEKDFVTKLKDGTIHKIPRGRPALKKDAVPVIFPIIKSEPIKNDWEDFLLKFNDSENNIYDIIKNHLDIIPLPSKLWSVFNNCTENFIAWIEICNDKKYSMKRVMLLPDLRIKITIGEIEIKILPQVISTIDEIPKLIKLTSTLLPCYTESTERSKNCIGYVSSKLKGTFGPQSKFCLECKKFKKIQLKQKKREMMEKTKRALLKKKIREKIKKIQRCNNNLKKKFLVSTSKEF